MKITMYELLGLVKDGKAPKKIKYDNRIWVKNSKNTDYTDRFGNELFDYYLILVIIDDIVEILDKIPKEKKIPEKIKTYKDRNNTMFIDDLCYKYMPIHKDSLSFNEQVIVDKLNEVLDYLKSKGDE